MAFGESWGIVKGFTEQVSGIKEVPTGPMGDAVFKTTRPDIANSTWYMFEASYLLVRSLDVILRADSPVSPLDRSLPSDQPLLHLPQSYLQTPQPRRTVIPPEQAR